MTRISLILVGLLFAFPLNAAYHLELEAYPAAAFPYFSKFGAVGLHVYEGGVRADTVWLDGFSRNGAPAVTVLNPIARMYTDIPVSQLASLVKKLGGGSGEVEGSAVAVLGPKMAGTVAGIPAIRHRLVYGPAAYIDVWTTMVVPENQQMRSIVNQMVGAISPGTLKSWQAIGGTPLHVELNFRRFKKVKLLGVKKFTRTADDEADALQTGPIYVKAPFLDSLWK